MSGGVPRRLLSSSRLYSLHLVDTVEEVPVMVRQLACQVLGAHQVQPISRAHRGPQLLRVWSLQVGEYSGRVQGIQGKGTRWEERVWGRLCAHDQKCVGEWAGVLQGVEGLLKDGASQGSIFLTAPQR